MDRNDWNGHFFTMADFSFLGSLSLLDTDKKKTTHFSQVPPLARLDAGRDEGCEEVRWNAEAFQKSIETMDRWNHGLKNMDVQQTMLWDAQASAASEFQLWTRRLSTLCK